jgi:hypothetical protein
VDVHSSHHPEVKGLNPADAHGTGREAMTESWHSFVQFIVDYIVFVQKGHECYLFTLDFRQKFKVEKRLKCDVRL